MAVSNALYGRRALVTGASRGIGAAIAHRLAAAGADIAITARTLGGEQRAKGTKAVSGSLTDVAAALGGHGVKVAVIAADLADADSRSSIVATAENQLGGPIDILVNNAAANLVGAMERVSAARRRLTFEVNLEAPIELMQAVTAGMRERGAGWIVNISSGTARDHPGPPFDVTRLAPMGTYGASKAALNRVTNAFAAELYGSGIRVNSLEPRAAVATEEAVARGLDGIPESMIEPVDAMADATLMLCQCGPEVTGRHFVSLDLLAAGFQ